MKSKRILCLLLACLCLISFMPLCVSAAEVTEISTLDDLLAIANDLSGNYKLSDDIIIDNSAYAEGGALADGFLPFGLEKKYNAQREEYYYARNAFTGTFDGNGKIIKGLRLQTTALDAVPFYYVGLFAHNDGIIKNLVLETPSVNVSRATSNAAATTTVGTVAAVNSGTVQNCAAVNVLMNTLIPTLQAMDTLFIGGLVGQNDGTIENAFTSGAIATNTASNTTAFVGGLVGRNEDVSLVTRSFSCAVVSFFSDASDPNLSGGAIAGYNASVLKNVYALNTNLSAIGKDAINSTPELNENHYEIVSGETVTEKTTYTGFDFESVWTMGTYPILSIATRQIVSAPSILKQPTNVTVQTPQDVLFSLVAQGGDLSYQWYADGDALEDGPYITGAKAPILKMRGSSDMCIANGMQVYCVVTNTAGSVTSYTVTLTVNHLPMASDWNSSATHHWYSCICGMPAEKFVHTPSEWKTVAAPSYAKEGVAEKRCTECSYLLETKTLAKTKGESTLKVFNDIKKSDWFVKNGSLDFAYNMKIFKGITPTTFEPNTAVTRGMFVTVLGRLHGVADSKKTTKFTDVKKGDWYSGFVKWASDSGVVSGTTPTTFAPNDPVTREQICAMMQRYCKFAEITLKKDIKEIQFNDASQISGYAKKAVVACQRGGIVSGKGDNLFDPKGKATRAEVATILMNFYKNYK